MTTTHDPPPADLAAQLMAFIREASKPLPLLFTAKPAAEFIGVSRATLFRMASSGELLPVDVPDVGRRWRRADLAKYVERLKPARRSRRTRATAGAA